MGVVELVRVTTDLRIHNRIELVLKSIIINIDEEPASEQRRPLVDINTASIEAESENGIEEDREAEANDDFELSDLPISSEDET